MWSALLATEPSVQLDLQSGTIMLSDLKESCHTAVTDIR